MSAPAARHRPAKRRRWLRWLLGAVFVLAIFAVGVGLGEALHDNPRSGGTQSLVRTLEPLPVAPAARSTVTVTVTVPGP